MLCVVASIENVGGFRATVIIPLFTFTLVVSSYLCPVRNSTPNGFGIPHSLIASRPCFTTPTPVNTTIEGGQLFVGYVQMHEQLSIFLPLFRDFERICVL